MATSAILASMRCPASDQSHALVRRDCKAHSAIRSLLATWASLGDRATHPAALAELLGVLALRESEDGHVNGVLPI